MRTVLYSLRTIRDKSELVIDLTGKLISETHYNIHLKLASGEVYLNKWDWLNQMKVYDDGDVFFIICTAKKVSRKSAFDCLMRYSIEKVDQTLEKLNSRVENLNKFKARLQREFVAA